MGIGFSVLVSLISVQIPLEPKGIVFRVSVSLISVSDTLGYQGYRV